MAALISMQKVFLNGEFIDKDSAKISIFDRGFIFGDGIYEVIPVINSTIVEKQDFWDRFERSLKEIDLALPYSTNEFETILNRLIQINSLQNADECFISAATIILLPVIKADGKEINGGKIGEFTTKLRELYKRALKLEANISS